MEHRDFASRDHLHAAVATEMLGAWQKCTVPTAVMLSGGSTPQPVFDQLAATGPTVSPRAWVTWTDDRLVAAENPASNYGNSRVMLDRLGIPPERRLRIRPDLPPAAAAVQFARELRSFFAGEGRIALGLLGLGSDGHTCSLFDRDAAACRDRLAIAVTRPDYERVSVTPAVLDRVDRLIFVVAGAGKAAIVERLLRTPGAIPAGVATAGHVNVHLWTAELT